MNAETPIPNPDYSSGQKDHGNHLKSTSDLAHKKRFGFESRLNKQRR